MLHTLLIRFGTYIQTKNNFLKYSVVSIGIPGAVALVLTLGKNGGLLFCVFLSGVALTGSWLWGVLMWEFFVKPMLSRRDRSQASSSE